MKISIIIPTFNEEKRISFLIRYLKRNSNSQNIEEIIVSDGGSTDKTQYHAKREGARVLISPRKGRGFQMNFGGKSAKGEILYFLHADTYPPKNFDFDILKNIKKGYLAGCYRIKFDNPHGVLKFFSWYSGLNFKNGRGGDQSLFMHRKIFAEVNGYDTNLVMTEDLDIVMKIIKIAPFIITPRFVLTSARKYGKNGIFMLEVIYIIIYALYYLRVPYRIMYMFHKKNIK